MKDQLIIVINNVAYKYDRDEFINKSFNSIYDCTKGGYFDAKVVIVDDSGEKLNEDDIDNYYDEIKGYPNVEIIHNKVNQNLLRSRFVVLDTIDPSRLKNTWIRFLDSGDVATNSGKFQMDLMMKMNDTNADLYLFLQGKLDEHQSGSKLLDSYYFSSFGDTNNKLYIVESILSSFLACPMWTKVYRADLFKETKNEIERLNNGQIPHLFHTEDFMINSVYAKYATGIASLDSMYILYDTLSGDSASRVVPYEYYEEVSKQTKITYDTIKNCYKDWDLIPSDVIDYYIGRKLNRYLSRFYYK